MWCLNSTITIRHKVVVGSAFFKSREPTSAAAAIDVATDRDAPDRWLWIIDKQDILDIQNEMVWDMPVTQHGMQMKKVWKPGALR